MSLNDGVDEERIEHRLPEINFPMLDHEKQIFIDIFEKDGLVILAKGLNYSNILCNLLWLYRDPGNLVLVVNSNEYEEKYFSNKLDLKPLPITSTEREKVYLDGGIYFVSTRVLVVDLLKHRVPVSHVTGVLVLRAHTVLESCQEAFALRLYRQDNKIGFIKAFSASPVSFTFGYHQVEKVMRALFVTELYLWPRFHGAVIKSLKGNARVEELRVPLSSAVEQMQACLLEIINQLVSHLKKRHAHLELREVTADNCITKQFHKILASQLDVSWHRLSASARELVQDLKLLRTLILELIHGDAVTFLSAALTYQRPEYALGSSGWVLHPVADQLYRLARGRVFNNNHEFDPELCPKWKCLTNLLLREIPEQVENKGAELRSTKILILCQDKRTCYRLNLVLTMGPLRYLLYMALKKGLKVNALTKKFDNIEVDVGHQKIGQEEEDEDDEEGKAESSYVLTQTERAVQAEDQSMFEPISQIENLNLTQLETGSPIVTIQTFKHNGDPFSLQSTLETLRPTYIIMYHSEVAAVRQLEHICRGTEAAPALYVVMYDGCVEEQTYLTALRREKQAFTHLIQAKAEMVVPSYQDGKTDEYFSLDLEDDQPADTRKAGGQTSGERPAVVVDVREFRSELPALLHKRRLQVLPLTIAVGDYVLTPEVCVERKAPADLASSLAGGRLHAQATELARHYPRPVLLLELATHHTVGHALWGADTIQRLQLLTLHFPRLKLVWSPSPYASAELFAELKQGRKNPDVAALAASAVAAAEEPQPALNHSARDFLRRVPAVTRHVLHSVLQRTHSLRSVAGMSQEELSRALDHGGQARDLHAVLHMRLVPDPKEKPKRKLLRKYCPRL